MNVLKGICYVLITVGVLFIAFVELIHTLIAYVVSDAIARDEEQLNREFDS